jgi:hypothetical protein
VNATERRSSYCFGTRISQDYLRVPSEGAQESAAHAVAIGKTGLPGDYLDRMAALLHHQPGGLDAQVLDRFGRRLAGLGAECTAVLRHNLEPITKRGQGRSLVVP